MSTRIASEKAVRVARALSDATRFEMLVRIATAGEICCRDIVEMFPVAQATVSHHLKTLADAGLLDGRRRGRFTYYSVRPGALEAHAAALARAFRPGRPARPPRATRPGRTSRRSQPQRKRRETT